ncbi:MAG: Outer-membrane lipoprotein carrier protein [Gammaproteobacteria bacterium]|nr:Outer-membrane lipoprotein carrier protein [Gammaproteobacteria bacterium]
MTKFFIKNSVLLAAYLTCFNTLAGVGGNLNHFFSEVQTYSARFQQVVLDEGFNPIEESSGRVTIKRPGRFRWDYEPPNEHRIISDGDKVWVYDVELEQVTVRSLEEAVGGTPAGLLAGGADIEEEFAVADLGQANGPLYWVRMVPKSKDVGFEDIRIGFEEGRLRVMELIDGLGQTTRITMADGVENRPIPDSQFQFAPPEGVDVIDETMQ